MNPGEPLKIPRVYNIWPEIYADQGQIMRVHPPESVAYSNTK